MMHPKIVSDLLIFREVVQQGSITKAARLLHTVQSNVTARIRLLEEEVGDTLLHRHAKGVSMTEAGARLLPWVVKLDALLREIGSQVFADSSHIHGSLRIGSIETVASLHITPLLARFGKSYPTLDLSLQTGSSTKLITLLLASELDLAFVSGPVHRPELNQELMFKDQLVIAAPRAFRSVNALSAQGGKNLKILFQRPDCSYTRKLETYLSGRGIHLKRAMQLGALDGILGCVEAGLGIAALPASMIEQSNQKNSVSVIPLPKSCNSIATYMVRRRDQKTSIPIDQFTGAIRAGRNALASAPPGVG